MCAFQVFYLAMNRGTDTMEVLLHYFLSLPKLEPLLYESSIWLPGVGLPSNIASYSYRGRARETEGERGRDFLIFESTLFFRSIFKKLSEYNVFKPFHSYSLE